MMTEFFLQLTELMELESETKRTFERDPTRENLKQWILAAGAVHVWNERGVEYRDLIAETLEIHI